MLLFRCSHYRHEWSRRYVASVNWAILDTQKYFDKYSSIPEHKPTGLKRIKLSALRTIHFFNYKSLYHENCLCFISWHCSQNSMCFSSLFQIFWWQDFKRRYMHLNFFRTMKKCHLLRKYLLIQRAPCSTNQKAGAKIGTKLWQRNFKTLNTLSRKAIRANCIRICGEVIKKLSSLIQTESKRDYPNLRRGYTWI